MYMTRSQKNKGDRRKFSHFRKRNEIFECQDCGKQLSTETHHFFCNECHAKRKKIKKNLKRMKKFKKYGTIDLR